MLISGKKSKLNGPKLDATKTGVPLAAGQVAFFEVAGSQACQVRRLEVQRTGGDLNAPLSLTLVRVH